MHKKRTKIVCTIGPASESKTILKEMVEAGMNVARLNFSHGTYENHAMLIKNIREVEEATGEPVAIMQDVQGPKIRVGILPKEGIELKVGEKIVFDTSIFDYKSGVLPIDYKDLHKFVKKGEAMLLDDGRLEVRVLEVKGTKISAEVMAGGQLISHKGINVPDSNLEVHALTDKDKEDIKFGVEHGVDLIALSFVTNADDVLDARYLIQQYESELKKKVGQPIRLIAKIERKAALKNIKEIIDAADGIMVARGDLGIEMPAPEVPLIQKKLVDMTLSASKPVIVATQMLDSMQQNMRPTRAEVSDVANAVIDHTDAVMLSNETATGKYPVEVVKTMADIVFGTEESAYDNLRLPSLNGKQQTVEDTICQMARVAAERLDAKIILAASISGETGRLISRYRPELPVVVSTSTDRVRRQLNLSWGVIPFVLEPCRTIEELIGRAFTHLKTLKIVKKGERAIIVSGEPVGQAGQVNLLEVREVV